MPVSFQLVLDAVPFTVQWLSLQDDSEDLVVKITLKYGKKKMCGCVYDWCVPNHQHTQYTEASQVAAVSWYWQSLEGGAKH